MIQRIEPDDGYTTIHIDDPGGHNAVIVNFTCGHCTVSPAIGGISVAKTDPVEMWVPLFACGDGLDLAINGIRDVAKRESTQNRVYVLRYTQGDRFPIVGIFAVPCGIDEIALVGFETLVPA